MAGCDIDSQSGNKDNMEQMVSTSLCGLPLSKAAIAIGIFYSVIFGGRFLYDTASAFVDWMILFNPPGLLVVVNNSLIFGMFSCEAFLCVVSGVCLITGAWMGEPGLVITWLLQQALLIFSSLFILLYYILNSYLKAPLMSCVFELFIQAIQGYFFIVVYAHFKELRKGNICERNIPLPA